MTFSFSAFCSNFWKNNDASSVEVGNQQKYGTLLGVYIPCMLMLFGVIIFLRLGWIVGIAGLSTTLIIITLASLIAFITVLSISAIATNIEVKAGGVYYILSRSLGLEAGAAIGLPLFFRQSLTISFCVIGFAESLKDLIPSWDITYIGVTTLAVIGLLAYTSTRGAMKVQVGIFIMIIAALVSLFTGQQIAPMEATSYVPDPLNNLSFWAIFAIFFPAMTGVESSISLSGDLRNPSKSLPPGTILSILSGWFIYVTIAVFLAYRVPADRLASDPLIMQDIASIPALIVVGIWGATLSSALGGMLAAPRTLKAIADDGIAPKIFSKTFGPMEEPQIATLGTFVIALGGVYFGSVNMIAPLLTMITLICYGVVNLSAGIETLMANPSWRPRMRIHWMVSIGGAFLCLSAMLMISAGYALISIVLVSLIYLLIRRNEFNASWLDIQQGILLFIARTTGYRLATGTSMAKSWRPHFLVFTEFTEQNAIPLLKFCEAISQSKGFLTMASFVPSGTLTFEKQCALETEIAGKFRAHNIQTFVKINETEKTMDGMQHMIRYCGLGPLVPNTILFGGIKKENKSSDFVKVVQTAFSMHYSVVIMDDDKKKFDLNKLVHVWWDDLNLDNSNMMLVLAYMMQSNQSKKARRICVNTFVADEYQRSIKLQQFQKFSIEKRLPIDIQVYVGSDNREERLNMIKEFSKEAEIVFISLDPPPKQGEPVENYVSYLQMISRNTESLNSPVLVLSSEHAPLEVLLQ